MANYYATARSNYFAVKDENAFREWAERTGLSILEPDHHEKVADGIRRFAITPKSGGDDDGWPISRLDPDTDGWEDIDVCDELWPHLADNEVAVLLEVGSEKLRYVTGTAVAVNNKGRTVRVNLESIYQAARRLGSNITEATY
ncbi:MAG: hypothetical protein V4689_01185 [Verrucomicrobiota bacterium]